MYVGVIIIIECDGKRWEKRPILGRGQEFGDEKCGDDYSDDKTKESGVQERAKEKENRTSEYTRVVH